MDYKNELEKLESDLGAYLISEIPRNSIEQFEFNRKMYLYRGLSLNFVMDQKGEIKDKTIAVRIGALEAQYDIESAKRTAGSLVPDDEHIVRIWLSQSKNRSVLMGLFEEEQIEDEDN